MAYHSTDATLHTMYLLACCYYLHWGRGRSWCWGSHEWVKQNSARHNVKQSWTGRRKWFNINFILIEFCLIWLRAARAVRCICVCVCLSVWGTDAYMHHGAATQTHSIWADEDDLRCQFFGDMAKRQMSKSNNATNIKENSCCWYATYTFGTFAGGSTEHRSHWQRHRWAFSK